MTDTERERLAGLADVEDIKVYQAKSRVRRRIEEELTFDVEILAEHHPDLFDELRDVVCEIDGAVASAEQRVEETDTMEQAEDVLDELGDRDDVDPIEAALRGWSYGRTDEEQEANRTVARSSLEWLRDEGGDEVRQSDVPTQMLADEDPDDRTPDTIWRSVVRGAWQHAAGQGYVDQPDSRAYRWVGDGNNE